MADQRDDLNSLDDTDALPPDLEDVHRLLLRDGARWRVRLPDSASHAPIKQHDVRVDRRVETPTPASPGTRGSHDIQQNVRKEVFMHDSNQIDDGSRTPAAPATATKSRFRGIAAVGAAVAIVALFAGLLYTFGPGRTTAGDGGPKATHIPATATTQRNDGGWSAVASLQQQPAVPILAPGHPAIVYEAGPSVLRRSDDGGQSWHTLTLPSDSGTNPADVSILVSPLDAQKVFLAVTAYQAHGVTTCPTAFSPGHDAAVASSGAVPLSSNIPSSGSITCTVQYYSADGGQHWTHLHAPSGAVLGNKNPDAIMLGTPSTPIFTQGTSLYTYGGCGPLCIAPDNYRILKSTDGGATWNYADAVLAGQGAHVCSFMPTSSGSTLFALTSTEPCSRDGGTPNPAFWSSTDGGASWSQATLPAGSQTPQSLLVVSHGSGQTLLYLNLQAPPQPHIGVGPSTPADLRVSADGGRHWSAAPTSGVPAGSTSGLGPVGALGDGTVVEPFGAPDGSQSGSTLYGWKQGDAAWHRISKPITGNTISLTIIPAGSGGLDQVWLVTDVSSASNPSTFDVSVLTAGK